MYTIGQVAEMFGLPISTLRYYDKQGLFPHMERVSGIRKFSDTEIEALRVIECLKKAGMEIKDIKQFMDWCVEGPSTYPQRRAMFKAQRTHVEAEIERMNRTLDMLKFKFCVYPEFRGNGTGRACAAVLLDWAKARGARYAELNYGGDERRLRFWRRIGFVENGVDEWGEPLMLLPPAEAVPFTVELLNDPTDWQLLKLENGFKREIGEETLIKFQRYKKNRVHAHRCSDTAQLQCMSRVVCTCSGDDSASSSTIFDCMRNQCKLFVVCHGRCLAGRSADNNCVNACCKLEIQQLVHDGKIDRTLLERRDERSRNALKYGLFQRIAPFGIISL